MLKDNKKVLFVCYGLGIGGIEKCLVNLLNILPNKYEVDVLLMNPYHTFKSHIKKDIHFLNEFDYVMNIEDTLSEIKNRGWRIHSFKMLWKYCLYRLRIKFRKKAWLGFRKIEKQYDVAIAYSHHDFSPYYVIDMVNAKKKCLWYHNGAYDEQGIRYERDKEYFCLFDKVIAVSTDCANILKEKFIFKNGQLEILKNICDVEDILKKSEETLPIAFTEEHFHIVTVGRMTSEKGAMLALDTCKLIFDRGYKICWHWVGDGNQSEIIMNEIKTKKMESIFILEGNQENPYPYIRAADLYVQTSLYEAYSTTITEAKILQKPIVTTDVGGMRDQLQHDKNGLIVTCDEKKLADAISLLIDNPAKRKQFSAELSQEDYSPHKAFEKYEEVIFS